MATPFIDPFTICRVSNGWKLKQYDADPEAPPFETVYEDKVGEGFPEAESLARCVRAACSDYLQDEDMGGLIVHNTDKGSGHYDS